LPGVGRKTANCDVLNIVGAVPPKRSTRISFVVWQPHPDRARQNVDAVIRARHRRH